MDLEEFKGLVRDNIVIDADYESQHSSDNNIVVSLRFDDEDSAFSSATIYIPDFD